ncbi:MAG: hypothetical protein AB7V08_14545 [Elusimicrobiales bacterium]
MKTSLALLLLLPLAACVDVPTGASPAAPLSQPVEAPYRDLDPGYKTQETAHFVVKAYSSPTAAYYAGLCEENYTRVMQDLGLYSFVPARPYNITVYRDAPEFHAKTGQPDWSGGVAYGNALLIYEGDGTQAIVAHEMTHLIFNEFMGLSQPAGLRWLNEGTAVYQETRSNPASAAAYAERVRSGVAANPIPFSQMVNLAPQNEAQREVDRWYAQVGSVVGFMIRRGGSFNFSLFLGRLRDGSSVDKALEAAYGGLWNDLAAVERAWKLEALN